MVVGVSVVHVVVWCCPVSRVGWAACGTRLCWAVVMMELVGLAVVVRHRRAASGRGGGVLVLLVVSRPLVLRERRPLCGDDL